MRPLADAGAMSVATPGHPESPDWPINAAGATALGLVSGALPLQAVIGCSRPPVSVHSAVPVIDP